MNTSSKAFLYSLLTTPSPTGFEQPVQEVVRSYVASFADTVETDLHGNVIVGFNTKAPRKVMLAGHSDQIGFMVKHITKDGYIYLGPLGGIDLGVVPGSRLTIHTARGPVEGVVGRKPIHHQNGEERDKMKLDFDRVWIDIGAKDQKEAEKRVQVGDPVTYELRVTELGNDLVASPGLDDKTGLFIAIEALRLCTKAKKLNVAVYAVSTVQEEVGLRGAQTSAYGVDPEVGIAIDVDFSTDNPGSDITKTSPVHLGKGPTIPRGPSFNPVVTSMLIETAKKKKIAHQLTAAPRIMGNDASAIQITRAGVASAALGVPNRYMHTQVEVCSLKDLTASAELLAAFIESIKPQTDFRPNSLLKGSRKRA
jgi:putative aminopeptidase FrvX